MLAREMMCCPVVAVDSKTCVADIAQLMADQRVGCVLVVDRAGKLCGVITQSDFGGEQHGSPFSMELLLETFSRSLPPGEMEKIRRDARAKTAADIMVTEVHCAAEDTAAEELARLMLRHDIDHIPIVRDGVPVGMVRASRFPSALIREERTALMRRRGSYATISALLSRTRKRRA